VKVSLCCLDIYQIKCFTKEGSDLSFQVLRIDARLGKVVAASVV